MQSFSYTIKDEVGIHARPAGMIAKAAKALDSEITITKGEKTASASKLMALMSLGVKCGDTVTVTAKGGNEEAAIKELKSLFENNL